MKRQRPEQEDSTATTNESDTLEDNASKKVKTNSGVSQSEEENNEDNSKYIVKLPNGAIKTTNISCQGTKCSFFGGNSGYCSVCWSKLSEQEKKDANEKQTLLEPDRTREYQKQQEEEKQKEQEKKEAAQREREAIEKQFEDERQKLKDENKPYPMVKIGVPDYKIDDNPSAQHFVHCFQMLDKGIELWSSGVYNTESGIPIDTYPSSDQLQHFDALKQKLSQLFRGVKIVSESDSDFCPYIIPVEGVPELRNLQSTEQILERVLGISKSEWLRTYDMTYSAEPEVFDQYVNKKRQLNQAIKEMKKEAVHGSFIVCEPKNTDSCSGPVILAARDAHNGLDVFFVVAEMVWT